MAGFLLLTTATSKPKKSSSSSSSSSGGVNSIRPPDVDVILLNSILGCSRSSLRPGCRLLQDFDDASTWIDIPSSEAVYYGENIGIGDLMDGKKEFYFLQIGPSGGQFTGAARELYPENQKERDDAQKLLNAVRYGGTSPGSDAAFFMHTSQPTNGRRILQFTSGKSHAFNNVTYLRKKGNRILFVEYSGTPLGDPKRPGRTATAWAGELFRLNQ